MAIDSVNSASNVVSFKGNDAKTEEKQTKTPEQIKDGKKKLALALTGTAVLGIAGIALTYMNHKTVQDTKKIQENIKVVQGMIKEADEMLAGQGIKV